MPDVVSQFENDIRRLQLQAEKISNDIDRYNAGQREAFATLRIVLKLHDQEIGSPASGHITEYTRLFGLAVGHLTPLSLNLVGLGQILFEMQERFYLLQNVMHDLNATNAELGVG